MNRRTDRSRPFISGPCADANNGTQGASMSHRIDGGRDLLLDDGKYFVQLDPNATQASDVALAFLGVRLASGGVAAIGSAERRPNESWRTCIAADPARVTGGFVVVAEGLEHRVDAIVAMWQVRGDAYIGCHAL
jgi:hypothetical protein